MESKAAKQYFSRVQRCLVCPAASRHQLLGRGRRLVAQFEQENPNAQYSDFVSAFGSPGDFAGQMLSCVDSGAVEATRRWRRCVKQIALIGLVLLLLVAAVFGIAKWSKARKVVNGDFHVVMQPNQQFSEEEYRAKFGQVESEEDTSVVLGGE